MSHNAVGSKEFERGHFKQCWVKQKFSGCWSASRLRLQALLNELLEKGNKGVEQASGKQPTVFISLTVSSTRLCSY